MLKNEIRNEFLNRRMRLSDQEWSENSIQMHQLFDSLRTKVIKWLLSYYPFLQKKEFDVRGCEEKLKRNDPSTNICHPRINTTDYSMEAILGDEEGVFIANHYQIPEPSNGKLIDPLLLDMVFVPLVAFDSRGFRVGYGKGYFDRYLLRCKQDVIKVGFSFFEPLQRIDDINEFDVPLNFCITPDRVYEF